MLLLRQIQWGTLAIALALMAALAIVFAVIIVIVAKYMTVDNDNEKESDVRKLLAGANCGGCGKAGCDDFAKALCEGKAKITDCNPTSNANKEKIADLLGIDFAAGGAKIAVVNCCGGNQCKDKYEYHGFGDCVGQQLLAGGRKQCEYGCMGSGTCVATCPEKAIYLSDGKAEVDKYKCVGCGACVNVCPKHIISLIPSDAEIYIACSSHLRGKEVMDMCKTGCIGCGICAKTCPNGAITMVDNLPIIDYTKCTACKACVAKCPRKTIKEL